MIDPTLERSQSRNKRKDKKDRKNKKRKKGSGAGRGKLKRAKTADKHDLYQRSVQAADVESKFFRKTFKQLNDGKKAKTLREDFCGTGLVCADWVLKKGAEAWGVDLDEPTLDWGTVHNVAPLDPKQQARCHLVHGDVRNADVPKVDVVAAQNFSFYIFHKRAEVLEYFKSVREGLNDDGMFVLDMLGGPACMQADEYEEKEVDHPDGDFIYCWEQEKYEPIHRRALYRIHFKFKDGSQIKNAFTYDWRMWTVPEVRDILAEAGFSETYVYWEGSDENGEGDGIFRKRENAPPDLAWVAYLIAKK